MHNFVFFLITAEAAANLGSENSVHLGEELLLASDELDVELVVVTLDCHRVAALADKIERVAVEGDVVAVRPHRAHLVVGLRLLDRCEVRKELLKFGSGHELNNKEHYFMAS